MLLYYAQTNSYAKKIDSDHEHEMIKVFGLC
jgi:hypothetical protein